MRSGKVCEAVVPFSQAAERGALFEGVRQLSNVELLECVIGRGSRRSAASVAMDLLGVVAGGRLSRLRSISPQAMARAVEGLNEERARAVAAAFELAVRAQVEGPQENAMRGPRDVWKWYAPKLEDLQHEEFRVALLNAQHNLTADVLVSRGILNSSLVHPREVFAAAISEKAASVVLVHNHPSGDPTPSADDRAITAQLVAAGRLLDIPVQDHIIVGKGKFISFAEAGLL